MYTMNVKLLKIATTDYVLPSEYSGENKPQFREYVNRETGAAETVLMAA